MVSYFCYLNLYEASGCVLCSKFGKGKEISEFIICISNEDNNICNSRMTDSSAPPFQKRSIGHLTLFSSGDSSVPALQHFIYFLLPGQGAGGRITIEQSLLIRRPLFALLQWCHASSPVLFDYHAYHSLFTDSLTPPPPLREPPAQC